MLTSDTISSLVNGISQQPATQRLASQGQAQENCYSSIVEGLMKRQPTRHIAKLLPGTVDDAFLHLINRDTTERYVVVATAGDIKVFDLDGDEKDVVIADGAADYLTATEVSTGFKAVTIADNTFLLNREKLVRVRPYGIAFTVEFNDFDSGDACVIALGEAGAETLGAELMLNGTLNTDLTSYTVDYTSASVGVTAGHAVMANLFAGGHTNMSQSVAVTPGVRYRIGFDIGNYTSGGFFSAAFLAGSTAAGSDLKFTTLSSNATFTYDVTATSNTLSMLFRTSAGTGSMRVDNVTVKPIGVTGEFSVVADANSTPTTIAAAFAANTSWYNTSLYTITSSGPTLTIVQPSPYTNVPFYLDASVTGGVFEPTVVATATKDLTPLVYVKQGNYGTNYTVSLYTTSATPDFTFTELTSNTVVTNIATDHIAAAIKTGLEALSNFNTSYAVAQSGSLLKITRNDAAYTSFTVKCEDGNGDRNMVAIQGSIQNFADLPAKCFANTVVLVSGDTADEDDYFVKFTLDDNDASGLATVAGKGTWKEWRREGETYQFDPATMPHILVRQADGSFTFGPATWDDREAGDVDSNGNPSFVSRTIEDVMFFRNRLGFLADDNVILSEAGEYFNFWRNSVQVLLDGDPIDVSAATEKVAKLRYAVPGAEKMLLMSDQQQLMLTGGEILTAKTASIKPTTAYETTGLCRPVGAGKSIYFTTARGQYTGLREYVADKNTNVDDAKDVTAHIPAYIPANVFKIATATNESFLVLLTHDEENSAYVYKFYDNDAGERLQASWSRWTYPEGTVILDGGFINTDLYLILQREDGIYLEVLGIDAARAETDMEFEVLLDRKVYDAPASYDSVSGLTTWTLPYSSDEDLQMVVLADPPVGFTPGQRLTVVTDGTTVYRSGNYADVPVVIGVPYVSDYEMSKIRPKSQNASGSEKSLTGARLQLRTVTLVYDNSGYFRVEVTPLHRDTNTSVMTPRRVGEYLLGEVPLDEGEFRFPVGTKSEYATIHIINDSPYPHHIMSASWEGDLVLRSKRM